MIGSVPLAGLQEAGALRDEDFERRVTIIGDEPDNQPLFPCRCSGDGHLQHAGLSRMRQVKAHWKISLDHCALATPGNPVSIDLLRRRPELGPAAVDNVLRPQFPAQLVASQAALDDIENCRDHIPKGAPIVLMYAAGNRYPDQFPLRP